MVPGLRLDSRERDAAGAYGRVRAGVLDRLGAAAAMLPDGVELLVIEGHRTTAEQARRFARHEERLRSEGVSDPAELRKRTSAFVSPVDVAPHCAGAAVDLTLAAAGALELDMGGPVNGHRTGQEDTCPMSAPVSSTARANRDLLAEVMTAVGFVNYPTEWWHWSFGDRYWALTTGAESAVYGPI
ncbi:M15 family metallopeptidase [Actinoallomurus sp. CA-150999]|uniref:M15 family metallopeptidase n=1 Tax=Actinoallomurus sp. CA-150999 TaxID=3239887 RepID=UPI003D94CB77